MHLLVGESVSFSAPAPRPRKAGAWFALPHPSIVVVAVVVHRRTNDRPTITATTTDHDYPLSFPFLSFHQRIDSHKKWSGRRDLNPGPFDPQSNALPDCATPRIKKENRKLERVTGIEPVWPAWKAGALPLSNTRKLVFLNQKCV